LTYTLGIELVLVY